MSNKEYSSALSLLESFTLKNENESKTTRERILLNLLLEHLEAGRLLSKDAYGTALKVKNKGSSSISGDVSYLNRELNAIGWTVFVKNATGIHSPQPASKRELRKFKSQLMKDTQYEGNRGEVVAVLIDVFLNNMNQYFTNDELVAEIAKSRVNRSVDTIHLVILEIMKLCKKVDGLTCVMENAILLRPLVVETRERQ